MASLLGASDVVMFFVAALLPCRRTCAHDGGCESQRNALGFEGRGILKPYKFIALEINLVLVLGDIVIPDLHWVVGGSLAGRVRWVPGEGRCERRLALRK